MKPVFTDTTIKHHRKMAKLKQQELADILEITVTDLSFIENKKLYPSLNLAYRIAELLTVTVGYLYSEAELNLMRERETT
jgi:DNA-binding XRE family transcriptional regulator